jgi:dephospho-CoA kinase
VPVHDSDRAVHDIYAGPSSAPIADAFPAAVGQNGLIDRGVLSAILTRDPTAFRRLEAIVHPLVSAHRESFLSRIEAGLYPMCVLDVPLLFETGLDKKVDVVLVVTASPAVQKQRVMTRAGMTVEKFEAILSRQLADSEKRRRAHAIIDTSMGMASAERQTASLIRALRR